MPTNETYKPTVNEIIKALVSEQQWLRLLSSNGKAYNTIIPHLDKDIYKDPDECAPTIGELSKETGITTAKLKKWIEEIYSDLWDLNEQNPNLFNINGGQQYELYYTEDSRKTAVVFTIFLNCNLQIYSKFVFNFINPRFETPSFYIKSILNVHEKGRLKTIISLQYGSQNQYRDMLADKLYFLDRIGMNTMHMQSNYERDEKLREIRDKYD